MAGFKRIAGEAVQGDVPNWAPLLALVGEAKAAEFMWMFEVRLSDGRRLDAYKHIETRCCLHLDEHGKDFAYLGSAGYVPRPARDQRRVLEGF